MGLKWSVKLALLRLGLDIRIRRDPLRFLRRCGFRTVLDIGANEGQFAARIRKILPGARICSFEPLPAAFRKLNESRRGDPHFAAFQSALGAENGTASFDMHDWSVTSSMLKPTARFELLEPRVAIRSKLRVPVVTLDDWAAGRDLAAPMLVKLDVQGFEDRVIRGGRETLSRASMVISEISFAGLYEGQPLAEDILDLMRPLDFHLSGFAGGFWDERTGEMLECDAIFTRGSKPGAQQTDLQPQVLAI